MSFEFVTKLPTPTEIKEQYHVPEEIKTTESGEFVDSPFRVVLLISISHFSRRFSYFASSSD